MIERSQVVAVVVMTLVAAVAGGLVTISHELSRERIDENQRARLLGALQEVLGSVEYDNDLEASQRTIVAAEQLGAGKAMDVYLATLDGEPVAAIFSVVTPYGYSGPIALLIGIAVDGWITGVRVTAHRETPGLGDAIDLRKSPWITGFTATRLGQPPLADWRVAKDGGHFDAITGATVTPRAITEAVKNTLIYFRDHGAALTTATNEG